MGEKTDTISRKRHNKKSTPIKIIAKSSNIPKTQAQTVVLSTKEQENAEENQWKIENNKKNASKKP